jgi:hypothetical protein
MKKYINRKIKIFLYETLFALVVITFSSSQIIATLTPKNVPAEGGRSIQRFTLSTAHEITQNAWGVQRDLFRTPWGVEHYQESSFQYSVFYVDYTWGRVMQVFMTGMLVVNIMKLAK